MSGKKRGAKKCRGCGGVNGARALQCRNCGVAFKIKKRVKRSLVSEWNELVPGDRVRVIGGSGPYYLDTQGRSYLTEKGVYTVVGIDINGVHARTQYGSYTYLYMGPEERSDLCHSLYRSPHKLLKLAPVSA
jgi:hypothetical protein